MNKKKHQRWQGCYEYSDVPLVL